MKSAASRQARPVHTVLLPDLPPGNAAPAPDADSSYREILGPKAWRRLHPRVRERFSARPAPGAAIGYRGVMRVVELSFMGWLFAQFCRLFGTPLAPRRGRCVPMHIRLEREPAAAGVQWLRRYEFDGAAPFVVRSTKIRSGARELTEYLGFGFSMRLRLSERGGNLYFISHAYDVTLAGKRLTIPHWLTPGQTTVAHEQLADNRFRFTLAVDHPWFGRTIYQDGIFA